MSDMYEEFLKRRSVRVYTDEPIDAADLKKILAAGLMAPTGKSKYPWEFIVVKDRAMLEKLSACRVGVARMLAKAACAIVVVGNPEITDTLIEDCTIAAAYMHLEASTLGLGSCYIQGRGRKAEDGQTTEASVRSLLGFPSTYKLQAILSLGHIGKAMRPHAEEKIMWEKVHQETFRNATR